MVLLSRYGQVRLSRHAIERWRQRTGCNLPQLVEAIATATRPTKQQLRRIKRHTGWQPKRILECKQGYLLIKNHNIVTVYDKTRRSETDDE